MFYSISSLVLLVSCFTVAVCFLAESIWYVARELFGSNIYPLSWIVSLRSSCDVCLPKPHTNICTAATATVPQKMCIWMHLKQQRVCIWHQRHPVFEHAINLHMLVSKRKCLERWKAMMQRDYRPWNVVQIFGKSFRFVMCGMCKSFHVSCHHLYSIKKILSFLPCSKCCVFFCYFCCIFCFYIRVHTLT